MANRTTVQTSDVKEKAKDVTEEVAALAEMLKEIALGAGEDLRGAAGERLEEVARRTQALAERARSRTQSELAAIERTIAEKPVQSALVAFAAGLVLGLLTRR